MYILKSVMAKESLENMDYFAINTVSADSLEPLGARPFAGTVMNKFDSCMGWALGGWRHGTYC